MDCLDRIRRCVPYLVRRLKAIEDAGEKEFLKTQVEDLECWLEIAREPDLHGSETLERVHDLIIEYTKDYPDEEAFAAADIDDKSERIGESNLPTSFNNNDEHTEEDAWTFSRADTNRTGDNSTTMNNEGRPRDTPVGSNSSFSRRMVGCQGVDAAAFNHRHPDQLVDNNPDWTGDDNFPSMFAFDNRDNNNTSTSDHGIYQQQSQTARDIRPSNNDYGCRSRDPRNYDNHHQQPYNTPPPRGRGQTPIFRQQQPNTPYPQRFPVISNSSNFSAPQNNFHHTPFGQPRVARYPSASSNGSNFNVSPAIGRHETSNQNHFDMQPPQQPQPDLNDIRQKAKQHFARKNKPYRYFQHEIFPIKPLTFASKSIRLANQALPQFQDHVDEQLSSNTSNVNRGAADVLLNQVKGILENKEGISAEELQRKLIQAVQEVNDKNNNQKSPLESQQPTHNQQIEAPSTGAAKNKRKPTRPRAPRRDQGTRAPIRRKPVVSKKEKPLNKNSLKTHNKKVVKLPFPNKNILKTPNSKNFAGKTNKSGASSSLISKLHAQVDHLIRKYVSENFGDGEVEFEDVKKSMMKIVCGPNSVASSSTSSHRLENKGKPAVTPTGSEDEDEEEEQVPVYSKENLEELRDALMSMLKRPDECDVALTKNKKNSITRGQKRKLEPVGTVKKRGRRVDATNVKDGQSQNKSLDDTDEESTDEEFTDEESTGEKSNNDDESKINRRVTRSAVARKVGKRKITEKVAPVKPKNLGPNIIQAPDILINTNLNKVKLEVDYIPIEGVKLEPMDEFETVAADSQVDNVYTDIPMEGLANNMNES